MNNPSQSEPARNRTRVVFVCFGNACRSQMAEALLRHLGGERFEPQSAGLHALGYVPAETVEVLEEEGISVSGLWSKGLEDISWEQVDVMVNLAGMPLPPLPDFEGRYEEWPTPDPFQDSLEEYRRVRDEIRDRVAEFAGER